MVTLPTAEATAKAMNEVRATCQTDEAFNSFLCAVERHYGTEHMKAAWLLALALAEAARAPAPYKAFGTTAKWIGELTSYGIYRRYCLPTDWATSPAALAGHTYS